MIASRQAALVGLLACLILFSGGCNSARSQSQQPIPAAPAPYLFDSTAAFQDLVKQCWLGPRDPRLPAHAKCKEYILAALKPYCDEVTTQNFPYSDSARNVSLTMTNIFGVINPAGKPRIMIDAHWDTRPTADYDFDIANRSKPIPGADDGASGVAVLIELAKALSKEKPKCCVILGFWDGEDWGPGEDKMYLGARYFGLHPGLLKPDESILLDMIGQKNMVVQQEAYSQQNYPLLVSAVWKAAATAGQGATFPNTVGQEIIDDQIPLARDLGVPSIDLIDFNYAYWHTLQDTPDKCDPKSLEAVGATLEQYIRDQSGA